jgi:predicted O-methyltransferase YrrM
MDLVHPDIDRYLTALAAHGDPCSRDGALGAERDFPIVGPRSAPARGRGARVSAPARSELGSGFGYSAYWFLRAVGPEGTVL